MTHSANNVLHLISTCIHCGHAVRLVNLNGALVWTHHASGYYTCGLNKFTVSGARWSEYEQWQQFTLAEPVKG